MPYTVSFDESDGIVRVTYSGTAEKEEHWAAFRAAVRLCQEHACSRLLVDFRGLVASRLSGMESFSLAEAFADAPLDLRIAHVLPEHDKARENICFASDVESNRGTPTGEFETPELARAWLLGER